MQTGVLVYYDTVVAVGTKFCCRLHFTELIFWKQVERLTFVHDFIECVGDGMESRIECVPDLKHTIGQSYKTWQWWTAFLKQLSLLRFDTECRENVFIEVDLIILFTSVNSVFNLIPYLTSWNIESESIFSVTLPTNRPLTDVPLFALIYCTYLHSPSSSNTRRLRNKQIPSLATVGIDNPLFCIWEVVVIFHVDRVRLSVKYDL
jgi:hypothetical protein